MRNFLVIVASIAGIAGPPTGWLISQVHAQDTRIAVIEANSFTSKNGEDIERRIADLAETIAGMPKETPPAWFKERVDRIEATLNAVRDSVIRLENKDSR